MTKSRKQRICFDFDGVINSYESGWHGLENLPDPPIEGVLEWIAAAQAAGHKILIWSRRTADAKYLSDSCHFGHDYAVPVYLLSSDRFKGINAIKKYIQHWSAIKNISIDVEAIDFPYGKAHFDMLIDDRAHRFNGRTINLPDLDNLAEETKPWFNKEDDNGNI